MKRRGRVWSRRRFIAGAGGLGVVALAVEGLVLEPNRLGVTRISLGSSAGPSDIPLRATVLTDLHLRSIGRLEEAVAEEVAEAAPDIVLVVGDAIDRATSLPILDDFLGLLPAAIPTYATLGNWEHWCGVDLGRLAGVYARAGGGLLVNESVVVPHGGREAVVVGVDDMVGGEPDLPAARAGAEAAPNALLLAHSPAYRDRLGPDATGLVAMLSGHTHGGQIAVGSWAPLRPRGSGDYVSGWYRGAGVDLFVSRGIGTSVIPVRLGSPPELVHLEWFLAPA